MGPAYPGPKGSSWHPPAWPPAALAQNLAPSGTREDNGIIGKAWACGSLGIGEERNGKGGSEGLCLLSLLPHPHAFARVLPRTVYRDKLLLTIVSQDLAHNVPSVCLMSE